MTKDLHQRFYFKQSPVRGDIVTLEHSLAEVLSKKEYPNPIAKLLGEMLVAVSLLASTIKIEGRLSIQIQSSDENSPLNWAMAECDHTGKVRGLAKWLESFDWSSMNYSSDILNLLNKQSSNSVLFINIEPENGQRYQGIVEQVSDNLSDCIQHYQEQSAQIPTILKIVATEGSAAGILVQKLPYNSEEHQEEMDDDLWIRILSLTKTISEQELLELPINDILYRLYHEEEVALPDSKKLEFGCTCSEEKCLTALLKLGYDATVSIYNESDNQDEINMDCHFCGAQYPITKQDALKLFN